MRIFAIAIAVIMSGNPVAATEYYVSPTGNDRNPGTSPARAWRTLERASAIDLEPGDRLRLEGGRTFPGTLLFKKDDRGTRSKPITIASYGVGRATILSENAVAIRLEHVEHFTVRNIAVIGAGRKDGNTTSGIHVSDSDYVTIKDVEASGYQKSGIYGWKTDNMRIVRVYAHDNGASGILVMGDGRDPKRYSRDLYIGYCRADNNPGDPTNKGNHSGNGILFGGIAGALVEYCEASGNGWDMPRGGNGPVGIWCWHADNVVIQYCIAHANRSSEKGADGGGFDFDGGVRNSILQYCLSYDNHGPGYLMYQFNGAHAWRNNTVRYCISINDGWHNTPGALLYGGWSRNGPIENLHVYNNYFFNDRKAILHLNVDSPGYFANNILVGTKGFVAGKLKHAKFESNILWNPDRPDSGTTKEAVRLKAFGLLADPKVALPAKWEDLPTDPAKLKDMEIFKLLAGSPCAGTGVRIEDNGGKDFFGNPVPKRRDPSIGIHEP